MQRPLLVDARVRMSLEISPKGSCTESLVARMPMLGGGAGL